MCTVLLPPGDNPIAVNKYIISYHKHLFYRAVYCGQDSVDGKAGTASLNVIEINLFFKVLKFQIKF
jgi:hypothetical protein